MRSDKNHSADKDNVIIGSIRVHDHARSPVVITGTATQADFNSRYRRFRSTIMFNLHIRAIFVSQNISKSSNTCIYAIRGSVGDSPERKQRQYQFTDASAINLINIDPSQLRSGTASSYYLSLLILIFCHIPVSRGYAQPYENFSLRQPRADFPKGRPRAPTLRRFTGSRAKIVGLIKLINIGRFQFEGARHDDRKYSHARQKHVIVIVVVVVVVVVFVDVVVVVLLRFVVTQVRTRRTSRIREHSKHRKPRPSNQDPRSRICFSSCDLTIDAVLMRCSRGEDRDGDIHAILAILAVHTVT